MTRDELTKLRCGECIVPSKRASVWARKKRVLYEANDVWTYFEARRAYYRKMGFKLDVAFGDAQKDTDNLLFERAGGEGTYDKGAFGDSVEAEIDPIRDLTWIYNHIAVKDVKPSDAPSPGAYAHLMFVQENNENRVDFFTKVYPRIIPSKSQVENTSKFYDYNRSTFDLLDRLLKEGEDGSGDVPIL